MKPYLNQIFNTIMVHNSTTSKWSPQFSLPFKQNCPEIKANHGVPWRAPGCRHVASKVLLSKSLSIWLGAQAAETAVTTVIYPVLGCVYINFF